LKLYLSNKSANVSSVLLLVSEVMSKIMAHYECDMRKHT